jgi:hypothetical protein
LEEYERQSDVSKLQAARDQKEKGRVKWMEVDDDDSQERESGGEPPLSSNMALGVQLSNYRFRE